MGKNRAEKAESIAWVIALVLILMAAIGISIFKERIQGIFHLMGLSGAIMFFWIIFHQKSRIDKEKRAQSNTTI